MIPRFILEPHHDIKGYTDGEPHGFFTYTIWDTATGIKVCGCGGSDPVATRKMAADSLRDAFAYIKETE